MPAIFDFRARGLQPPRSRPAIPNGPESVAALLDRALREAPDREALVDRHGRYTYRELDILANRAAHALRKLGVRPYDRVAVSLGNSSEIVIAFLGAMRVGAIWVGVNRALAPPEKAFILRDSSASVFLGDREMVSQVAGVQGDLPSLGSLVEIEPGCASCPWAELLASAGDFARFPEVEVDPFAPAAIAYTSGTSGHPKGAVHSQHNLLLPGAVATWRGDFSMTTRHGCVLPLTILNLMVLGPVSAYQSSGTLIAIDRIDAAGLAEWIRREHVGHFAGVPTIIHDLLSSEDVRPEDLATLGPPLIGGADVPESLSRMYKERFGKHVTVGYGMTEAPTAVTMTDGSTPPEPGCAGRALPQVEIHIVDDLDRDLPPGDVGEICVAPATTGPWAGIYTTMLGYWEKSEATERALSRGMFHSGDLGALAADGTLSIRGRRSDLIIRGGANVYPAEVERVLLEDGRVEACAVLGRPDARLGECVVAFVRLRSGGHASREDLTAHCQSRLARYKIPEELVFVEDLPRNAMGKIVKRELARRFFGTPPEVGRADSARAPK